MDDCSLGGSRSVVVSLGHRFRSLILSNNWNYRVVWKRSRSLSLNQNENTVQQDEHWRQNSELYSLGSYQHLNDYGFALVYWDGSIYHLLNIKHFLYDSVGKKVACTISEFHFFVAGLYEKLGYICKLWTLKDNIYVIAFVALEQC